MSFYKDIEKYPLLTREEEVSLARLIQQGDEGAREKLILSNLRLVVYVADKFSCKWNLDDLIAEGNIGLMRAADEFDPDRGVRFSAYAYGWIQQGMFKFIEQHENTVRIPHQTYKMIKKIIKAKDDIQHEKGREATVPELVDRTELLESVVKKLSKYDPRVVSREETGQFTGVTIDERDYLAEYLKKEEIEYMELCLDELPDNVLEVVSMHYGIRGEKKHSLKEIGEKMGRTHQRIQQLSVGGVKKIKKNMNRLSTAIF